VVICLKRGADLHVAQLMPLPLTVSCFNKIQTGFTFLVPADAGSPGQRADKRVCVCVRGAVGRGRGGPVSPLFDSSYFTTQLSLTLLVKEFLRLVNIWRSYGQNR